MVPYPNYGIDFVWGLAAGDGGAEDRRYPHGGTYALLYLNCTVHMLCTLPILQSTPESVLSSLVA